jgi:hypothetical protein
MPADNRPPVAKVMDEAIDLGIEGRSPYPERAAFVDADIPSAGREIERAADEGLSIVLVSAEGSTRVLKPEHGRTASDEPITDELVDELAAKAKAGFDLDGIEAR